MTDAPRTLHSPLRTVICPECGYEMLWADGDVRGPVECLTQECRLNGVRYHRPTIVLTRVDEDQK